MFTHVQILALTGMKSTCTYYSTLPGLSVRSGRSGQFTSCMKECLCHLCCWRSQKTQSRYHYEHHGLPPLLTLGDIISLNFVGSLGVWGLVYASACITQALSVEEQRILLMASLRSCMLHASNHYSDHNSLYARL